MFFRYVLFLLFFLSFGVLSEPAETTTFKDMLESQDEQHLPLHGSDEFGREIPRTAVAEFFRLANAGQYEDAANIMDFRHLPDDLAQLEPAFLAHQLHSILQNSVWVDLTAVSDKELGAMEDGLPSYRDRIARLEMGDRFVDILMQRVPGDKRDEFIWKFSNATVKQIPELYTHYGNSPAAEWLEKRLPKARVMGVELWQLVFFFGAFSCIYILLVPATWLLALLLSRIDQGDPEATKSYINGPLRFFIAMITYRLIVGEIQMPISVRAIWEGGTLLMLAWWWMLMRSAQIYFRYLKQRWIRLDTGQPIHLLGPALATLKFVIAIILLLVWLERLGFSATTVLAGLGIGGIAIALAAQKTVENIIGAIILYSSRPVSVGQLCRFGKYVGVVEEIGLRSSSIRTLTRSVIHIPNAKLADAELENISERERIRYAPILTLEYGAKSSQLRQVIEEVTALLEQHERVLEDGLRVHIARFSDIGHELEISSYIDTVDFIEYMDISEVLNLDITDILERNDVKLTKSLNLN